MRKHTPPPPVLASAQVIAYAVLDQSVRWTGKQALFVDGERLGPVPRLAICRNIFGDRADFLIFHCDTRWNVKGVAGAPSVRECKASAERWYEGLSQHWVNTNTTHKQARQWLRERCIGQECSLCGMLPVQVEGMFSRHKVNVCFACVRAMHAELGNNAA
jgi:hypothetical protein